MGISSVGVSDCSLSSSSCPSGSTREKLGPAVAGTDPLSASGLAEGLEEPSAVEGRGGSVQLCSWIWRQWLSDKDGQSATCSLSLNRSPQLSHLNSFEC